MAILTRPFCKTIRLQRRLCFPRSSRRAQQDFTSLFKRISFYGYHQWQIFEPLQLIGGVTYDRITYPENFRSAPISGNETTADQVSPKAGLIWTPLDKTTVRFAYTRSLAGASLDQSYQMEPSQVAGFVQSTAASFLNPSPGQMPGPNLKPTTFRWSKNSPPELIWAFPARY